MIPFIRCRDSLTYFLCIACVSMAASVVRAEVRLPALFADHAVLQRDRPVPIWGWAEARESMTVSLGKERAEATADRDGRWKIVLKAQPVSKVPLELIVAGKNRIVVKDILLGDVWLCSGQSNMSISLGGFTALPEVKQDIAKAEFPLIRQFGVLEHFADEPQTDVKGEWLVCSPRTSSRFAAVAYYFACKLHAETGVPIGILRAAKGSTRIESWLSQETLLNTKELEPYAKTMRESLDQWEKAKQAAMTAGIQPGTAEFPLYPFGEKARKPRCVTLHNGMIAPLAPYAIRGAVWYQGEGNAGDPKTAQEYVVRLRTLIRDWRTLFGDESMPVYIVQLPAYREPNESPGIAESLAFLRESQRQCLKLPNTGMAVTIDIGEAGDIHPKNKIDVGDRLAQLALAADKKIVPCGPLFRDLRFDGNKAIVEFDHIGNGLMVGFKDGLKRVAEAKGTALTRFAIAGKDKKWFWAEAKIDGKTVTCSHAEVPNPVAVRYAFSANPSGANLYNRDGFPASPFRSDDW